MEEHRALVRRLGEGVVDVGEAGADGGECVRSEVREEVEVERRWDRVDVVLVVEKG